MDSTPHLFPMLKVNKGRRWRGNECEAVARGSSARASVVREGTSSRQAWPLCTRSTVRLLAPAVCRSRWVRADEDEHAVINHRNAVTEPAAPSCLPSSPAPPYSPSLLSTGFRNWLTMGSGQLCHQNCLFPPCGSEPHLLVHWHGKYCHCHINRIHRLPHFSLADPASPPPTHPPPTRSSPPNNPFSGFRQTAPRSTVPPFRLCLARVPSDWLARSSGTWNIGKSHHPQIPPPAGESLLKPLSPLASIAASGKMHRASVCVPQLGIAFCPNSFSAECLISVISFLFLSPNRLFFKMVMVVVVWRTRRVIFPVFHAPSVSSVSWPFTDSAIHCRCISSCHHPLSSIRQLPNSSIRLRACLLPVHFPSLAPTLLPQFLFPISQSLAWLQKGQPLSSQDRWLPVTIEMDFVAKERFIDCGL